MPGGPSVRPGSTAPARCPLARHARERRVSLQMCRVMRSLSPVRILTSTPARASVPDGRCRIGLRRVDECGKAGKGQLGLVVDQRHCRACGRRCGWRSPSTRNPSSPNRSNCPSSACARLVVERAALSVRRRVVGREPHDVLRRALDDEQPRRAVIDQHRYAAALEIERHLVELLPAGVIGLPVGEDGLVERALDAALERSC